MWPLFLILLKAVAARLEQLLRECQLQQGRCGRGCMLRGASGGWEQAGQPYPLPNLWGGSPTLPGVAEAAQQWFWTLASLSSLGPRKQPPPAQLLQVQKCLLLLPGLSLLPVPALILEQSCGRAQVLSQLSRVCVLGAALTCQLPPVPGLPPDFGHRQAWEGGWLSATCRHSSA